MLQALNRMCRSRGSVLNQVVIDPYQAQTVRLIRLDQGGSVLNQVVVDPYQAQTVQLIR